MLPDEKPGPDQTAAFWTMTGEQRLRAAEQLWWSMRRMKAAGVRAHHPEWTETQVEEEVRRILLRQNPDEAGH